MFYVLLYDKSCKMSGAKAPDIILSVLQQIDSSFSKDILDTDI